MTAHARTGRAEIVRTPASAHIANVLKDALPLHLQDAQHAPPTIAFHSPTGTTLALLHLLGQADAGIHLHQASTTMEAAGLASQHKWGIILPTSARVANSIYEPAIATIYPTLCKVHDKQWRIGTPRSPSRAGHPTGPRHIRLDPSLLRTAQSAQMKLDKFFASLLKFFFFYSTCCGQGTWSLLQRWEKWKKWD